MSRFKQNVLPLATSLVFHATLVVLGVLTFRTLVTFSVPRFETQTTMPDVELFSASLPVDFGSPLLVGSDPPTALDAPTDQPPALVEMSASVATVDSASDRDVEGVSSVPLIDGTSSAFSADTGKPGVGGPRAGLPFGLPDGRGTGNGGSGIFRQGTGVRSVAYVCDASGSMIDKFDALRRQLDQSVARLKPVQSFNVIFFGDDRAAALSGNALLQGAPANKDRAKTFLAEIIPSGATDPIPALELALKQQPELIWLLTDGDFPDNTAVLELLRRRNPGGKVRINTIAFVERGDGYEKVLQTIAAENRGEFRFISERELQ